MSTQTPPNTENGNVLWFILIAIVLLGGLTMVLSRGGSSVDQSGDREQGLIKASELMRYAKSIEAAVQQLVLYGCSENEISFDSSVISGYSNASAPSSNSCHIFEAAGAGLTARDLSSVAIADGKGTYFTPDLIVTDVGTAATDLTILIGTTTTLCDEVNDQHGLSSAVATTITDWNEFTGTYTNAATISPSGSSTGCLTMNGGSPPVFFHVIMPR